MNVMFHMNRTICRECACKGYSVEKNKYLHTISAKKSKVHDKIQHAFAAECDVIVRNFILNVYVGMIRLPNVCVYEFSSHYFVRSLK